MRILLVTSTLPWPTHGGGNQRTNLLHRALSMRGDVDVLALSEYGLTSPEHWSVVTERFGGKAHFDQCLAEHRAPWRWLRTISRALPSRLARTLGGWGIDYQPDRMISRYVRALVEENDYSLIVSRYMWPLARSGAVGLRPVLLDVDDFRSDVIEAEMISDPPTGLKKKWVDRKLRQVLSVEGRILSNCDHVWVAKPSDEHRVGHDRRSLLPNIPFTDVGQTSVEPCIENEHSQAILIVGTLEHPVNVRAVEAFLTDCWPKIHQEVPGAVFRIVGSGMTSAMRETWVRIPGVEPIGYVEDLRDIYNQAAFSVVPIREGGGTKIKVLESLMMGRACVCVPHSLRGYEDVLVNGESIQVAEDDTELVRQCVKLLHAPEKRAAIAEAGRRQVLSHYSYDSFAARVTDAVDKVLACTRQERQVNAFGDTAKDAS